MTTDFDDYDDDIGCEICGSPMERVCCWQCGGDGGFHDCGEDCCCCLDKEEITIKCAGCKGVGHYNECLGLPHTDEQMAKYRKAK